jgi:tRNA U34 5-methylaminomethyl-2-thiouridine-forming methyltransferase MnmC
MKREFLVTGDGSLTIHLPEWNEQYHSRHGAIAEAKHVFLKNGLDHILDYSSARPLRILEVGFGTGLNALLTMIASESKQVSIDYTAVEAYPVPIPEINKLNYPLLLKFPAPTFQKFHTSPWESAEEIAPYFALTKQKKFFSEIKETDKFHLIYFDAFGARVQPELWTELVFKSMYNALVSEGVLVTYAAKGSVRRAMQAVGFFVERLPGPPGKREMLRATKK